MKTLKIFSITLICCTLATASFAQKAKTETFKVSGNCGMCESKIEKAAKAAGATFADWDKETKIITVKYNSSSSNLAKIQKSIAESGYDNAGAKATNEAYDKLHSCCKYERTDASSETSCCDAGKCTKENCAGTDCCKDGKCEMQACKDAGCCKDGKCDMAICKEKGCCKEDAMHKH